MRKSIRIIIIEGNKILLIHRLKEGREYYVLPGGGIEPAETPEQTVIRETKEETNLDVARCELLWKFKDEFHDGVYFLAKEFKGRTKIIGPELEDMNENNVYELKWVALKELKNLTVYPLPIRNRIIKKFLKKVRRGNKNNKKIKNFSRSHLLLLL
jgi:mutator protein MutT